MQIDLALLADAATVDASGKLNILGVFDRIDAQAFPAQHGRIALVLRFTGDFNDAGQHVLRMRLADPNGQELAAVEGELHLGPPPQPDVPIHIPHIINMDGVVFGTAGTFSFDVYLDGQHEVSVPLTVGSPGHGRVAQA